MFCACATGVARVRSKAEELWKRRETRGAGGQKEDKRTSDETQTSHATMWFEKSSLWT